MGSMNVNEIHVGNSIVSIETHPDYAHPVVIKKPASPNPSRRLLLSLRREYEMTRTLDGVEGVRKAFKQTSIDNQPALILEYIEGENLRDTIAAKSLSLNDKLEIAVDLTRILKGIHQQNVIHLDLNSKNILIGHTSMCSPVNRSGFCCPHRPGGPSKSPARPVLGTLSYISPEQTGRINRAVDERSDLYSLGVVFYELMSRAVAVRFKGPDGAWSITILPGYRSHRLRYHQGSPKCSALSF